ncbi:MAG: response regulator transcription factor, partial [Primorskyibacter sp.]
MRDSRARSATPARVLIVEDKDMTAQRLARIVQQAAGLDLVGVASTLETGLAQLNMQQPDIVLVDLGLPDGNGIDIIHAASDAFWGCDAIVISIFGDEGRVVSAIQAGAKGYIQKGGAEADIVRSIESLRAGGSPISPQIARHLLTMLAQGRIETADARGADHGLTARETEVLRAVSRGFKRQEIADQMKIS